MENIELASAVKGIMAAVLDYANGGNSENRNFFSEMDQDPSFQKSYQNFEKSQKVVEEIPGIDAKQAMIIASMVDSDLLALQSGAGGYSYYEPDMVSDSEILRMAGMTEAARVIKNHRRLQLNAFGKAARQKAPGLRIAHKDPEHELSEKEKKEISYWSGIVADKFFFLNGERKPSLGQVLSAAYEDFFDLGRLAFYVWRARSGKPLGMILVDPALVKPIVPENLLGVYDDSNRWDSRSQKSPYLDSYRYLLVSKDKIKIAKFTERDMIVYNFFKRSSYHDLFGGQGIIGQAIKILSGIINSLELNQTRISGNSAPRGILAVQGGAGINEITFEKFKKFLWAQTQGAANRWRIPILGLPDKNQLQWLPLHDNNKDIMYFEWFTLLFTMFARLSGTDPNELSMSSNKGMMDGKSALFQTSQEGVIRKSSDVGLRMFLTEFADAINDTGVIQDMTGNDDYIAEFSGLDVKDEKLSAELNKMLLDTTCSVNDLLRLEGKKTYEKIKFGDFNPFDVPAIGSQQIFQIAMTKIQQSLQESAAEKQASQGVEAEGGGENEEGGEDDHLEALKKMYQSQGGEIEKSEFFELLF